jgi:hypothetical protein
MAGRSAPPPRPPTLALRVRGEASWVPGYAEKVGGGENVCVAWASAARLAKDYERLQETGVAMIHWAMSRIMLLRLARAAR